MRDSVRRRYEAKAQSGDIAPDEIQRSLADALDNLIHALESRASVPKNETLGWLRSRGGRKPPPRGLYIWGGVGRGKTLLMDLFFSVSPTERKRRVHFHEFIGEVHDRIAVLRRKLKNGKTKSGDPIPAVAADIASEIELLCFDEFSVHDIADAMILGRLFVELFARRVTVVSTSNVAPDDLYKDGLNRALFLPFIALVKMRMAIFHLDAPRDYRLDSTGSERRYVTPLGPEADACLDAHFRHLTGRQNGEREDIHHKGRRIVVPEAAVGVARFPFADLCARPLGAGDYLKAAEAFHTIILSDVPVLSIARRNEAKRLINLVDTLYDKGVRLIVSAAAEPGDLWTGTEGNEAREFARTASRLIEMRSDAYWETASHAKLEMKKTRAVQPGPFE